MKNPNESITHGGQTINLFGTDYFPAGPPSQIFIGISGGLDSAALLFLICTHFPDIEIHTYNGQMVNMLSMDHLNAIDVIQWHQEHFPEVTIHDPHILKVDPHDSDSIAKAKRLIESGEKVGYSGVRGLSKTLLMNDAIAAALDKLAIGTIRMSGMTANPPIDIPGAEPRRSPEEIRPVRLGNHYHPLTNVDKRFVAGVFHDYDLMSSLFPLTGSCIASAEYTDYGNKECGGCYWCLEKKWAFII